MILSIKVCLVRPFSTASWINPGLHIFFLLACSGACVAAGDAGKPLPGEQPVRSAPSTAAQEALTLRHIRRLTFAGTKNGEAYFSPDGRRIVFQGVREPELKNPFYQIYTQDLATGVCRRVSSGKGRTTCSNFHPQKERLIFASSHLDPEAERWQAEELEKRKLGPPPRYQWAFDPTMEIFETGLDGQQAARLTNAPGYDAECAYSPDGTRIVFCSFRDSDGEIYVMDADGKNPTRLTNEKGYDGGPFFSPNGKEIVWRHFTEDEKRAEVWLMNADGTQKRPVTKLGAMAWGPFFHPSGQWIAFASNHEDVGFEVYAIRPDGSDLTRLTYCEGFDGLPVFSPDGRKLLWTSTRSQDGSHLYLADVFLPDVVPELPAVETKVEKGPIDIDRLRAHVEYLSDRAVVAHLKKGAAKPLTSYLCRVLNEAGLLPAKAFSADRKPEPGDFLLPESGAEAQHGNRVAGVLLPQNESWAEAVSDKSEVRFLLLCADFEVFRHLGPALEKDPGAAPPSNEHLAAWLEILRELAAVAKFRSLKLGILFVAHDRDALDGKAGFEPILKGLIAEKKLSAAIYLSRLGSSATRVLLCGLKAGNSWRILAEQLAGANTRQRFHFLDARVELKNDRTASILQASDLGLSEVARRMSGDSQVPALIISDFDAPGGNPAAEPNNWKLNRFEPLRDRATVALGAVYRLATGDVELKYEAFDPAAAPKKRPYLGTKPKYQGDGTGVVLENVYPGSPAERAGVQAGDKLVRVGEAEVRDAEGYLKALEKLKPGDKAQLVIEREGKELRLDATIGER